MDERTSDNYVFLRGTLGEAPEPSHESRGERFYRFTLDIRRLSGTADSIHVLARERLLDALSLPEPDSGMKLCVSGELRSFNNRSGVGARLVISVFAHTLWFEPGEDEKPRYTIGLPVVTESAPCLPPVPQPAAVIIIAHAAAIAAALFIFIAVSSFQKITHSLRITRKQRRLSAR